MLRSIISNLPKSLVVTGVPGTGKTTLAASLSKKMGMRHLDLAKIALEVDNTLTYDRFRRTRVVDVASLRRILKKGESLGGVIVDGHFAPFVVDPKRVHIAIVLRCNPLGLAKRLKKIGASERKIVENARAEALDICLVDAINILGVEKIEEIDTTGSSPKQTLNKALTAISGRERVGLLGANWLRNIATSPKLRRLILDGRLP